MGVAILYTARLAAREFILYRSSPLRRHRDDVGDNAGEYVADCGTEKG
jgi:hypothetical protein